MPSKTSIKYLERRTDCDGRTLYFMLPSTDRRKPPEFVDREDVPEPENGGGWFECERVKKGPWLKWRAIRRVEPLR